MRLTSRISFYNEAQRHYNPKTSRYEGEIKLVDQVVGNATDLGVERSVQLFGKYDQRAKVLRLIRPARSSWSFLTIDDQPTHYRLRTAREVLKGTTLIVGDDHG